MSRIIKSLIVASLGLTVATSFAKPPAKLISHNRIDVPTRAYLGKNLNLPQKPTLSGMDKEVTWVSVSIMCMATPNICPAKIAVMTKPEIILGVAKMNLKTGEITPKELAKGGYRMTVLGKGEIQFTKD